MGIDHDEALIEGETYEEDELEYLDPEEAENAYAEEDEDEDEAAYLEGDDA